MKRIVVIDKAVYTQLLVKYQPKVIETKEEYNQARCILLELVTKIPRSPEETEIIKLMVTLAKKFDEKQAKPEKASPHEVLLHLMKSQAKILGEIFQISPTLFI